MDTARLIAPEIDRLVLGVNQAIEPRYAGELHRAARRVGLDALGPLIQFADFLLGGTLTPELAERRFPYLPPGTVASLFADLEERGHVTVVGGIYRPDDAARTVLETVISLRGSVAHDMWADAHDVVIAAWHLAAPAVAAVTDDYPVAAAHRTLPDPEEPCLRLHHRLVTLRYVRAQAHVDAWRSRDLSPAQIVTLTALWHDEPHGSAGLDALEGRGWVAGEPAALTDAGRTAREAIEADTISGAEPVFDALGEAGGQLVSQLASLPIHG
jgi:hypothetical protein